MSTPYELGRHMPQAIQNLGVPPSFVEQSQLVPNHRLRMYKGVSPEGEQLFVKVYKGYNEEALSEIANYDVFSVLDFVPRRIDYAFDPLIHEQVIEYEYLEGCDYDKCLADGSLSPLEAKRVLDTSVDHVCQMSRVANEASVRGFIHARVPALLRSPIRAASYSSEVVASIQKPMQELLTSLNDVCGVYGGWFTDRNPRNIWLSGDRVYQLDFGVLEYSSPWQDIAKLIRNGVQKTNGEVVDFASVAGIDEQAFVYELAGKLPFHNMSSRWIDPYCAFQMTALHTHLFYLSKYYKELSHNPSPQVQAKYDYHYDKMSGSVSYLDMHEDSSFVDFRSLPREAHGSQSQQL